MIALITQINGKHWHRKFVLLTALLLSSVSSYSYAIEFQNTAFQARISIENNGSQILLSTAHHQWKMPIESFSILGTDAPAQNALNQLPFFYRGHVQGSSNSWARLNSDKDLTSLSIGNSTELEITGHIFADDALFELQHDQKNGHSIVEVAGLNAEATAFFTKLKSQQLNVSELTNRLIEPLPLKAIKIGIMVDSQYNEHYNDRGLAEALSVINAVDGLFQDQLGLAIIVERFKVTEDPETDPLRHYSGSMENMLSEFRQIRQDDSEFPADLALVHLFTGYRAPEQLIGISWINTLCQLDGYDISISTPYTFNKLLTAHEIAHNLGATHDNSSQCLTDTESVQNGIMWSELSSATQSNFSTCSLDAMKQSLSSSCVQDDIDMALTINSTPTSNSLEQQIEVSAINWDPSRTSGQVSSITSFPDNTQLTNPDAGCVLSNSTMTCQHGTIDASSRNTYTVTALLSNSETVLIGSELYFSDFTDSNKADNRVNIQINAIQDDTPSQESTLASGNSENNGEVALGASAKSGSFGPLGLFLLGMFSRFYTLRRQ